LDGPCLAVKSEPRNGWSARYLAIEGGSVEGGSETDVKHTNSERIAVNGVVAMAMVVLCSISPEKNPRQSKQMAVTAVGGGGKLPVNYLDPKGRYFTEVIYQ
jgi:hypothetical protein